MKSESAPLRAQFFRGNRLNFALALGASLLTAGLNLLIARVLQQMIDAVSGVPARPAWAGWRSLSALSSRSSPPQRRWSITRSPVFWSGRCGNTRTALSGC